jgi:3-hydroxyacyl-CoA dehydrogenase
MIEEALKHVAIIGAGGKMGSGIAALLLQEIACSEARLLGKTGTGAYDLILVDLHEEAFPQLRLFLKQHLTRYAEKQINALRIYFSERIELVSNAEIIGSFVEGALNNISYAKEVSAAKESTLVFEAIVEDVLAKNIVFSNLKALSHGTQFYFTNTSAIPISLLDEMSQLDQRIVGFHFYNPPILQKVVEWVFLPNTPKELQEIVIDLSQRLGKVGVRSQDIPGFIGNGYLIREIQYAFTQVEQLMRNPGFSFSEAIYCINYVTQVYLLRPMGVFQLIDYIGIDVICNIMEIMSTYLDEPLLNAHASWMDILKENGWIGGQQNDGSQKQGWLFYEVRTPVAVYSLGGIYHSLESIASPVQQWLGEFPEKIPSWKSVLSHPEQKRMAQTHRQNILKADTPGALLAAGFLQESHRIADLLVQRHVAENLQDVYTVLSQGLFHLILP